jgi:hypothetical protein
MPRLASVSGVAASVVLLGLVGWVTPGHAFCSVFDERPCIPSFCSVFDPEPCLPEFDPPIGQDLRLTIESLAETDAAAPERELNSIRELFSALRTCWAPPERDRAQRGMTVSVRFAIKRNGEMLGAPRVTYVTPEAPREARDAYREAVSATLARCMPLPLTTGLAGAIAGRPIAIRFIDNRAL